MTLPKIVLIFRLLHASKIPRHDCQLVLTDAVYKQKDNLFQQIKNSLPGAMGSNIDTSRKPSIRNIKYKI